MLVPGSALFDERKRVRAEVKADGTLAVPGSQGSIHRLGAIVQGKTACNGWTYWHFEKEGKLTPIDSLREKAKVELGLSAPVRKVWRQADHHRGGVATRSNDAVRLAGVAFRAAPDSVSTAGWRRAATPRSAKPPAADERRAQGPRPAFVSARFR